MAPAGTPLKGLNYLKGRDDPVALAEEEYPGWLWHLLDVKGTGDGATDDGMGDEFCRFSFPLRCRVGGGMVC